MRKKKNPFFHEYVQITLNVTLKKTRYTDSDQTEYTQPFAMQGYLLDENEDYLFLGDDLEAVTFYVNKTNVAYVEVIVKKDKYDDMIDGATEEDVIFS